jgi:hypothetical protein
MISLFSKCLWQFNGFGLDFLMSLMMVVLSSSNSNYPAFVLWISYYFALSSPLFILLLDVLLESG